MLNKTIKKSVIIDASTTDVWKALTDPKIVKEYFFGTNVKSDWKEGSDIVYSGSYEGKDYEDKGVIKEITKEKSLRHTYWSSMSGVEDKPENYAEVAYELKEKGSKTELSVSQTGFATQEACDHSAENWEMVLNKLKETVESKKMAGVK